MQCDLCNKPAVVHEVTVKNGVKKEVHLCEEHAAESGFALPMQPPINKLLTQFVISHGSHAGAAAPVGKVSTRKCPECGLPYNQFRQSGILGCPQCYEAFAQQLAPLIQRAQDGATNHAGRTPRRAGKCIDRQLQRQRLIRELDQAVDTEQYERAAKIRDMLNSLEVETPQSPEEGAR